MIAMRSKVPVLVAGRIQKECIVAISITEFVWEARFNSYRVLISDYEVTDKQAVFVGDTTKKYTKLDESIKHKTKEEVDAIFSNLNISLSSADSFTEALKNIQNESLLADIASESLYGLDPSQWELVDTATE
jgi:hypothetical protein